MRTEDPDQLALERSRRMVLPELLARTARRHPGRTALVHRTSSLTYAQLEERVVRAANALAARGVGPGDNVGILMHNRLELLETSFGCHRLGACAVPISHRLGQGEVDDTLEHARAVGVVADAELAGRAARTVAHADRLRFHLATGEPTDIADSYEAALADASPEAPAASVEEDDPAYLMYTSGTSGAAKGVVLTHRNVVAQILGFTHEVRPRQDDVWMSEIHLSHVAAIGGLLAYLYVGGAAVIPPSSAFDAARTLQTLRRHRVTACFFVPSQWERLCRIADAGAEVPALRTAIWGAAPASRATLEAIHATFPHVGVLANFGQTEMSPSATWLAPEDAKRKLGSIGRPAINVDARVVDDDGRDVAPGAVGEIVYRGPSVMKGYFRDPDATAAAFAGGWLHSGDLVRQDAEGYLYLVGRKSEVIVTRDGPVHPARVEEALLEHPGVAEAAVLGTSHPDRGRAPLAVVVTRLGAEVGAEQLLRHCSERLNARELPSRLEFVDALPRNRAGKVLKRALHEAYAEVDADGAAVGDPG